MAASSCSTRGGSKSGAKIAFAAVRSAAKRHDQQTAHIAWLDTGDGGQVPRRLARL